MRRSLALRRTAAALALPILLALTSCGDDAEDSKGAATESTPAEDSSESPDAARESAADDAKTEKPNADEPGNDGPATSAGTESPLRTLDLEEGDTVAGKKFADLARWALDNATTANIALESTAQGGVNGSGSIDHRATPLALQLTIEANGSKGDVRLVDGAIYMTTAQLGGDKYLKLDISDVAGTGLNLSEIDPSRSLEQGMGKKKFTYRGVETIEGERAQHFSADDVDIWFDESGLLRRVKRDAGAKGVTTATYSDWGAAVDISAPPADQVQEMPSLPKAPRRP